VSISSLTLKKFLFCYAFHSTPRYRHSQCSCKLSLAYVLRSSYLEGTTHHVVCFATANDQFVRVGLPQFSITLLSDGFLVVEDVMASRDSEFLLGYEGDGHWELLLHLERCDDSIRAAWVQEFEQEKRLVTDHSQRLSSQLFNEGRFRIARGLHRQRRLIARRTSSQYGGSLGATLKHWKRLYDTLLQGAHYSLAVCALLMPFV